MSKFLLINKPKDITSHDVVSFLRKITQIKKIGHAGTLDPFATGLLILAIERESTRQISKFVKLDKKYIALLKLGQISDTYDVKGKIEDFSSNKPSLEEIESQIKSFLGEIEQIPPMFSAKKIGGKKLYQLARKGQVIERKPQKITIFSINLLKYDYPYLELEIHCSSGTYIRSLAHDLGQKLKCGAYTEELKRTQIGPYKLENAIDMEKLNSENWENKVKDL